MRYLCDTNILSELVRPRPDNAVLTWSQSVSKVAVSAITVEEINFGLAWKPNPRIEVWFEAFLESYCEVLPVTTDVARRAGEIRGGLNSRGKIRSQADMLIAATAQLHGLTLVTRNSRDFEECGIPLLNPFV